MRLLNKKSAKPPSPPPRDTFALCVAQLILRFRSKFSLCRFSVSWQSVHFRSDGMEDRSFVRHKKRVIVRDISPFHNLEHIATCIETQKCMWTLCNQRALSKHSFLVEMTFAQFVQVMNSKTNAMHHSHQNYGPIQQGLAGKHVMQATIQNSPTSNPSMSDVSTTDFVSFQ